MTTKTDQSGAQGGRSVVGAVLDFFSSVRLGIVLLVLLFVYCTVGSAGVVYPTRGPADFSMLGIPFRHDMVRQWRAFEMTEFEWFHTPVFLALIGLICVNLVVTTLRRIPLNAVNLGVWMIHTGIIVLALSSVVYFSTKVEGDTPVIRRDVVITVPGAPGAVRVAALAGNGATVRTDAGEHRFAIASIDPAWELLTGEDAGKRVFAVSVQVTPPPGAGQPFVRQLLDGYPEYTEDVLPGRGRVKKLEEFGGDSLVDAALGMALQARPQPYFWLKETAALYLRPKGAEEWSQRRIEGLPRYNDYVSSVQEDIWPAPLDSRGEVLRPDPLSISVPGEGDALAGADVRVTGFLRFAVMQDDWGPGGPVFNPMAEIAIETAGGASNTFALASFDPSRRDALDGRLAFRWVNSEEEAARYTAPARYGLTVRVPRTGDEAVLSFTKDEVPGEEGEWTELGESGFAFRVRSIVDRLPLADGTTIGLAIVDIRTPDSEFSRWVFADPEKNRDNYETAPEDPHRSEAPDPRIETDFTPATGGATLTVIAGPQPGALRVIRATPEGAFETTPLRVGQRVQPIEGLTLTVKRLVPDAQLVERPRIVPWRQRDKDADSAQTFALVRVEVSEDGRTQSRWLPLQRYAVDDVGEVSPVLTRNEPAKLTLTDGREVEIAVSRERTLLPAPVILDEFVLTTNVGGFSGRVSSIRDWTSEIRFLGDDGPTKAMSVSTNNPKTFGGLSFFQAFWDAPQSGSSGLTFTGLGVGNRIGVAGQLAGSILAAIGMVYAFYIKPIIKRRRRDAVMEGIASGRFGEMARRHAAAVNGARETEVAP